MDSTRVLVYGDPVKDEVLSIPLYGFAGLASTVLRATLETFQFHCMDSWVKKGEIEGG